MTLSVSIIGIGRLGGALAIALSEKNYSIRQLVSYQKDISKIAALISPAPEILSFNELGKLSADLIFICVPDTEIGWLAQKLAETIKNKSFVFHTSGALSSNVLQPLEINGCHIGSLHPLISVSDSVSGARNFKDAFFCVEGEAAAVEIAEKIAADLEGKSFTVPTEFKTLYHASAVMASGHLIALLSSAVEMLQTCGLNETKAREILRPLIESTLKNLSSQTFAEALTGPFARADFETIRRHLKTLCKNAAPQILESYRQLGLRSLHLAEEQGADKKNLAKIEDLMRNEEF